MTDRQNPESTANKLDLYHEASEACRNYSRLTERVRTLALHVLTALVVGAGIAAADVSAKLTVADEISSSLKVIGTLTAIMGLVFVSSMNLIAWHYQSAFEAVRDYLAAMEERSSRSSLEEGVLPGPWCAHKAVRTVWNDRLSTYGPFVVIYLFLIVGLLLSVLS